MKQNQTNTSDNELSAYNAGYQVGYYKGYNKGIKVTLLLHTVLMIICYVIYKLS